MADRQDTDKRHKLMAHMDSKKLDPMPRVDLPPSTDYLRGLEAGRVGTQAAVAAAMMMAAEWYRTEGWKLDEDDVPDAILALITPDAMAALEAKLAEALRDAEKEILQAAGNEYTLEHSSEGPAERMGRNSAVRGMMVRLGLYGKMEAAIDAALEAKP